ncbi:histone H3-K56 acetyltransferase [Lipomyces japonicus]|uniref:histone H3-K56 acetyltransferase n=1 Tax=Lipomyces japonicus TaxID=56871 RepID=UPI0034CD723B
MSDPEFWSRHLSAHLPHRDTSFVIHHIATKLQKKSLTQDPADTKIKHDSTLLATHFLTVSYNDVHLVALELLVYATTVPDVVNTLFVSKADTTGYEFGAGAERVNIGNLVTEILRVFLKAISRPTVPSRICLFAKSQPQYIFPESFKNSGKHVLTDRQLIKWWVKVTNPLLSEFERLDRATLDIPGADAKEVDFFLQNTTKWKRGYIFLTQDKHSAKSPAVKMVPNFPDDPKSRFLDVIVSEGRAGTTTVAQFFTELQYRQEFLLGNVVGIVGISGQLARTGHDTKLPNPTVDIKAYPRIHDAIVTSNYSSLELAKNATRSFINGLPSTAEFKIIGTKKNDLQSSFATAPAPAPARTQQVNLIGSGLIRKRAKPAPPPPSKIEHSEVKQDQRGKKKQKI